MSLFNPKIKALQVDFAVPPFSLDLIVQASGRQYPERDEVIQDIALEQISQISRTPSPALGRSGHLPFEEEDEGPEMFQPTPAYFLPEGLFDDHVESASYPSQGHPVTTQPPRGASTPLKEEALSTLFQPLPLGTLQAFIAPTPAPLTPDLQQMDLRRRVSPNPPCARQPTLSRVAARELAKRKVPPEFRQLHLELQYLKGHYLDMRIHPNKFHS